MRIKKKDLRKRLAQLPINYPAPTVEQSFDYELQKSRVEDLCRHLAHNEVEIRDAALNAIPLYLKEISEKFNDTKNNKNEAPTTDDLDLLLRKLSLGIFYCFWHCDKPLAQHECINKISRLIYSPKNPDVQINFLLSIFAILSREWGKIDRYRLDKYMALVRNLIYHSFLLINHYYHDNLKKLNLGSNYFHHINKDLAKINLNMNSTPSLDFPFLKKFITFFQQKLLLESNSVGLTMHLMDVILDELVKSDVEPELFVSIVCHIPLFAMSKGNYIEKRVLDMVIAPIASGLLDEKRNSKNSLKSGIDYKKENLDVNSKIDLRDYKAENNEICLRLAEVCKLYSISKDTVFLVRNILMECQKLLMQYLEVELNPNLFRRLTKRDFLLKINDELKENDHIKDSTVRYRNSLTKEKKSNKKLAKQVYSEIDDDEDEFHSETLSNKSELTKKEKKKKFNKNLAPINSKIRKEVALLKKVNKAKKEKSLRLAQGESIRKISVKGIPRNSKRKKIIAFTKKDLFSEDQIKN